MSDQDEYADFIRRIRAGDEQAALNRSPVEAGDDRSRDDPAERLWLLWRQGLRPDLDAFLAQNRNLSASGLAAVLRVDQRERWRAGERVQAESYLDRYLEVRDDPEAALDLIHGEFLFRKRAGEKPDPADYVRRFPDRAEALQAQLSLHLVLAATNLEAEPSSLLSIRTRLDHDSGEGAGARWSARGTDSGADTRLSPSDDFPDPSVLSGSFGRYRIIRLLGQGGMARVYLAHDDQLDRPVALKVPYFGARLVPRFYREARIAATFNHPHLCPVYDVGEIDGVHYLTMPVLEGETLALWMKRQGPLPEPAAVRLIVLMARALQVAHESGVIHRDLKPANVMLNARQEPVVMDFGLARSAVRRDAESTNPGILIGTPAYSPPEQVVGDPGAMGPGCDIYSLGVILYELLTGRLPFSGPLPEVTRLVLTSEPDPPSRYRPDLDAGLEAICLTAMAKRPEARYPSMETLAEALEDWRRGDAPPSPQPKSARRWLSRRAAALGLAGLCAAGLGGYAWLGPRSETETASRGQVGDAFRAGTTWIGGFKFRPPIMDYNGDVEVVVTSRDLDHFRGIYKTEQAAFAWEIEGTVRGETVQWSFTRAIHLRGSEPDVVVGRARVEGELHGETMKVVFDNPGKGTADEWLRLKN
jgi:hypothetical protein